MAAAQLDSLLKEHPYLESPGHELHKEVIDVRARLKAGDEAGAKDMVERVGKAMEMEIRQLNAAFSRFSHGAPEMKRQDIKLMSEYLGFPSGEEDITKLILAIDRDHSGSINIEEFTNYVGRFGGCMKFFEVRRAQIAEKLGTKGAGWELSEDALGSALKLAGIDEDAQAYWRLVVPPSEFVEAGKLRDRQQRALNHIRKLAKSNHEKALVPLQKRVAALGYKDTDLWLTLAWIRELAPILVHVHLDKMLQFFESDTHYRNQFETKSSGGLLNQDVRKKWEKDLFGGKYDDAEPAERPKYGVLNVMNDYRGVVKCKQYGESYLLLKDARLRCTFSPEDSANLKAERLAVLDFYAHVLFEYSDAELVETLKVANSKESALLGDSEKVGSMKYKETQIHGDVALGLHVERLVIHQKHKSEGKAFEERIARVARKNGWNWGWMDEEQTRMKKEEIHKLGAEAWTERLARIQETVGKEPVPEGLCKVGCGRHVAPGATRNGRPFTTCCKGCVMGFGHDLRCGQIDPTKVGQGLCKNGCGKKVAQGTDSKGRALDTCCRGCALGKEHDAFCGQEAAPGMCKMGCGRPVCPPQGTRRFDTCCRDCATARGTHSKDCGAAAG